MLRHIPTSSGFAMHVPYRNITKSRWMIKRNDIANPDVFAFEVNHHFEKGG